MRHPNCDRDPSECRLQSGGMSSTCMGWSPVYDGNGKLVASDDPNVYTTQFSCGTCGRSWSESRRYGKTTVKDDEP